MRSIASWATSSGTVCRARIVRWRSTNSPPLKPAIGVSISSGANSMAQPGGGRAIANRPAVEAGDRGVDRERVEQHGHAERRPAAGDGEADAGLAQRPY